jgi:hypothetical protein
MDLKEQLRSQYSELKKFDTELRNLEGKEIALKRKRERKITLLEDDNKRLKSVVESRPSILDRLDSKETNDDHSTSKRSIMDRLGEKEQSKV